MSRTRLILLGLAIAYMQHSPPLFAQGRAVATKSKADAEQVRTELKDAIELLRKGDHEKFFLDHMPVETLRDLRKEEDYPEILKQTPKERIDSLINDLSKFQDAPIEFGPNQLTATFVLKLDGVKPDLISLKPSNSKPAQITGYGRNLNNAIAAALTDLSADPEKFGQSMLPVSQLAYYDQAGWDEYKQSLSSVVAGSRTKEQLRSRVPINGVLQSELIKRDLEALKDLKPKFEDNGSKAIFTLPKDTTSAFPIPDDSREIIFELVDGHWRFYSGSDMQAAIDEQMKNKPSVDKTVRTMVLERVGNTWRLMLDSFE